MKALRFLSSAAAVATFFAGAVVLQAADAGSSADADFASFNAQKAGIARAPGTPKDMGAEAYFRWHDGARMKMSAVALDLFEKYPADPRRWDAIVAVAGTPPLFIKSFGPDVETEGMRAAVVDEPAKAAWEAKMDGLRKALVASNDAPAAAREATDWYFFAKDFRATTMAKSQGESFDYAPFHARFDAHAAKYSDLPNVVARARDYLGALENSMPGMGVKEWNYLLESSPNEALRTMARQEIDRIAQKASVATDLKSKPLELAFTAVDGRPVDVAKLRGKVVLIDFWATWCGPCIAELPNVKNVYATYHDKGFEIVGISLEAAGVTESDSPEKAEQKMAKAKTVLTNFTAKENMPWPQYFDGKHWNNNISTQYAIEAIPAMFLLDTEGRVVSTDARGEMLEIEVKRLLKL